MKKVFISFSSKNQQLAEKFLEFLQLGMGLRRRDVFCTVFPEKLQMEHPFLTHSPEPLITVLLLPFLWMTLQTSQ